MTSIVMTEEIPETVTFAKALADDTRQRIMELCCCNPMSVTELVEAMQVAQPTVSHHLSILRNAGLVHVERRGKQVLYQLNQYGICASSGSACTSGSLDPSHVLKAMHVEFTAAHGSIRFSLSRYNTEEDIDHIIKVFPTIVRNLRKISPYWDQTNDEPRKDIELTKTSKTTSAKKKEKTQPHAQS